MWLPHPNSTADPGDNFEVSLSYYDNFKPQCPVADKLFHLTISPLKDFWRFRKGIWLNRIDICMLSTIDYRWDEVRFWSSTHDSFQLQLLKTWNYNSEFGFLKKRYQESQMSPCFSSCIRSRLTHQLLGLLKSAIPNLWIYLPKRRILRSCGWGLTIHVGYFFCVRGWTSAFRGFMTGFFGFLESLVTRWYQDVASNQH